MPKKITCIPISNIENQTNYLNLWVYGQKRFIILERILFIKIIIVRNT